MSYYVKICILLASISHKQIYLLITWYRPKRPTLPFFEAKTSRPKGLGQNVWGQNVRAPANSGLFHLRGLKRLQFKSTTLSRFLMTSKKALENTGKRRKCIFSFSHRVFYSFWERKCHFINVLSTFNLLSANACNLVVAKIRYFGKGFPNTFVTPLVGRNIVVTENWNLFWDL